MRDYPIRPVPFTAVHLADEFWAPRIETNRKVTVWYDFKQCEDTGRIDNFAKAGRLMPGEFVGIYFNDSDVYKVIEGASYCLAVRPDPKLDKYLDDLIAKIAAAQEKDGYLYTCRTIDPAKAPKGAGPTRWSNEVESHELYNAGHLYEAAVAHYQATGKKTLLEVAIKSADLVDRTFGPGKLRVVPGHQEIELALVKLYRVTGQERYLRLAKFFLEERGKPEGHKLYGPNQQDHLPVTLQTEAVGHAVRAGYMYTGMADIAAIVGEPAYEAALDSIWMNMVSRRLYLTGGIGATGEGEAFGNDYQLPNLHAYGETCAAIGSALWNQRMFLLRGDAKYVDVLERVIYNGFLSGVSLSGDRFFYVNPLAADGNPKTVRQPWFGCACCPVNVVRFVPSLPGYVYAVGSGSVYVNLFAAGNATVDLGGQKIKLTQETRYPWDGRVKITVEPQSASQFTLRVRIPGWATGQPVPSDLYRFADDAPEGVTLKVNREAAAPEMEKGYARLARTWAPGDAIELNLPMPVRRVLAHEKVKEDAGRVALQRGPIVYCAEAVDNGGHVSNLVLPSDAQLTVEHRADLLGGVTVIRGSAMAVRGPAGGGAGAAPAMQRVAFTAIPYYAWNHRGAGEMAVWLPTSVELAKPAQVSTRPAG